MLLVTLIFRVSGIVRLYSKKRCTILQNGIVQLCFSTEALLRAWAAPEASQLSSPPGLESKSLSWSLGRQTTGAWLGAARASQHQHAVPTLTGALPNGPRTLTSATCFLSFNLNDQWCQWCLGSIRVNVHHSFWASNSFGLLERNLCFGAAWAWRSMQIHETRWFQWSKWSGWGFYAGLVALFGSANLEATQL